jgi:hypothetical protein
MGLHPYAEQFAQAGMVVVAFDYRGWGTSGGSIRHYVSWRRHLQVRSRGRSGQPRGPILAVTSPTLHESESRSPKGGPATSPARSGTHINSRAGSEAAGHSMSQPMAHWCESRHPRRCRTGRPCWIGLATRTRLVGGGTLVAWPCGACRTAVRGGAVTDCTLRLRRATSPLA